MLLHKLISKLLNRLKFWQKYSLIGLIMVVPLVLISLNYLADIREDWMTIEQKVAGANYNVALKEVLQHTQQSGGLNVAYITGERLVKEKLDNEQKLVDESLSKVIQFEDQLKYDFTSDEQLQAIVEKWKVMSGANWNNAIDIQIAYDELNSNIIQLMNDVANKSELMLASSPAYYNLINTAIVDLPQMTENITQMESIGTDIINSGDINQAQKDTLSKLVYLTEDRLENIKRGMDITLQSEELNILLSAQYEELNTNIEQFLSLVEKLDTNQVTYDNYDYIAKNAIESNYQFYSITLDSIVNKLEESFEQKHNLSWILFVSIVLLVFFEVVMFVALYTTLRDSVRAMMSSAREVSNGNLNVHINIKAKDEMKRLEFELNNMIDHLKHLVYEISSSTEQVSGASEELNASAEEATASANQVSVAITQMASHSQMQAQSLSESSLAMDEMSVGIQRIAENSGRVSHLTNDTTELAQSGQVAIDKTRNQMEMIKQTVELTHSKITQLKEQSEKINSIVKVISEISTQTNLLSLNASIEAARAGEHGKGFAVVAEEVKVLADQSKQSAAQISALLEGIQNDTIQSVNLMKDVTENVVTGIEVTEETADKFNQILTSIQALNPEMDEISATATQFASQTEQVVASIQQVLHAADENNKATVEIAASTQEQLAIMEDVSSSATSLAHKSESLQQVVAKFRL